MEKAVVPLTADAHVTKVTQKDGSGASPSFGSIVSVHYKVLLNDRIVDSQFASDSEKKQSYTFKLGSGTVPTCWEIALPTMKTGEQALITSHHDYAFGKFGLPPHIPPQASVSFQIELVSTLSDPNDPQTFADCLSRVEVEKTKGNTFVQSKNYRGALRCYQMALARLEGIVPEKDSDKTQLIRTQIALFLNLSLCALKLEEPREALRCCERALQLDPSNGKALFRCGQAYDALKSYQKALEYFQRAAQISPDDPSVTKELTRMQELIKSKSPDELLFANMFRR